MKIQGRSLYVCRLLEPNFSPRLLLKLKEDILDGPSTAQLRAILAVDPSKAFDNVSQDLILTNLQSMVCREGTYNYVRSFLRDRRITPTLGPLESQQRSAANRGTPQGSIISPPLFNIAMIGLPPILNSIEGTEHPIYTYDIAVWMKRESPGEIEEQLLKTEHAIENYA